MTINETITEEEIILLPAGSIDTVSTPEFQQAVLMALQKSNSVIVDMTDVTYVSSAGLRAFLIGQKTADAKKASFIIKNSNEMVLRVFDMSGFSKLLKIE